GFCWSSRPRRRSSRIETFLRVTRGGLDTRVPRYSTSGFGGAHELEVDILEARPHDLHGIRFAIVRGDEPRDECRRLGGALLADDALLSPAHDRHPRIRPADLVDAADVDEPASGDHARAVAELGGLVEIVGGEQD